MRLKGTNAAGEEVFLDVTQAIAVPGDDYTIDFINPHTGRTVHSDQTLEQVRARAVGGNPSEKEYARAELVNIDEHLAAKAKRQDSEVTWSEVTEDDYNEMLCCLPPAYMGSGGFLVGEASDHHAGSGKPRFAAYCERGEFFTASRPMTVAEFKTLARQFVTEQPAALLGEEVTK